MTSYIAKPIGVLQCILNYAILTINCGKHSADHLQCIYPSFLQSSADRSRSHKQPEFKHQIIIRTIGGPVVNITASITRHTALDVLSQKYLLRVSSHIIIQSFTIPIVKIVALTSGHDFALCDCMYP